jgi:hypothetical protein
MTSFGHHRDIAPVSDCRLKTLKLSSGYTNHSSSFIIAFYFSTIRFGPLGGECDVAAGMSRQSDNLGAAQEATRLI